MMSVNHNLESLRRSGIRLYTNLAREVGGCVMLTLGEPDFPTPEPIRQAAVDALANNMTHYAPNQGLPQLVQAIADRESVLPQQVLVTVGATGALYTALTGILNPGDEVIVPYPAYSLYDTIITAAGARTVRLDTRPSGFQITPQALQPLLSPRTKAIVVNSPNNPTGTVYNAASLAAVRQAALERELYVICDNVYDRLVYGEYPDLSRDPALREQLLLCQSFSKPWAMTGWRAGYLVGPERLMERLLIFHAAQVTAVPTFVQVACVQALQTDITPMLAEYARRRDYCVERLEKMGLSCPRPEGAFYLFVDVSRWGLSSDEFCTRLIRQAKVATVPGSCFGDDGFLRISYCCAMEQMRLGLDRLEQFLQTL